MNQENQPIEIDHKSDEKWMEHALRQAEHAADAGEVPVGCVVVQNNRIIGRGYNQVETLKDATAHAEIIALGAASSSLDNWRLEDTTLYVTLEPCPMCAGAILNSRVSRVVYGTPDLRLGACGTTMQVLSPNPINRPVTITGGVLQEECLQLIQAFFATLRERNKSRKKKTD